MGGGEIRVDFGVDALNVLTGRYLRRMPSVWTRIVLCPTPPFVYELSLIARWNYGLFARFALCVVAMISTYVKFLSLAMCGYDVWIRGVTGERDDAAQRNDVNQCNEQQSSGDPQGRHVPAGCFMHSGQTAADIAEEHSDDILQVCLGPQ
jgi:hypothetical protein